VLRTQVLNTFTQTLNTKHQTLNLKPYYLNPKPLTGSIEYVLVLAAGPDRLALFTLLPNLQAQQLATNLFSEPSSSLSLSSLELSDTNGYES